MHSKTSFLRVSEVWVKKVTVPTRQGLSGSSSGGAQVWSRRLRFLLVQPHGVTWRQHRPPVPPPRRPLSSGMAAAGRQEENTTACCIDKLCFCTRKKQHVESHLHFLLSWVTRSWQSGCGWLHQIDFGACGRFCNGPVLGTLPARWGRCHRSSGVERWHTGM